MVCRQIGYVGKLMVPTATHQQIGYLFVAFAYFYFLSSLDLSGTRLADVTAHIRSGCSLAIGEERAACMMVGRYKLSASAN